MQGSLDKKLDKSICFQISNSRGKLTWYFGVSGDLVFQSTVLYCFIMHHAPTIACMILHYTANSSCRPVLI